MTVAEALLLQPPLSETRTGNQQGSWHPETTCCLTVTWKETEAVKKKWNYFQKWRKKYKMANGSFSCHVPILNAKWKGPGGSASRYVLLPFRTIALQLQTTYPSCKWGVKFRFFVPKAQDAVCIGFISAICWKYLYAKKPTPLSTYISFPSAVCS